MVYKNLVKTILDCSGIIKPIIINSKETNGTGLCNASLLFNNGELHMILRNVEYTLYHAENKSKFQSRYEGPLSYYHRDDDLNLRTNNYYCIIDQELLEIKNYNRIDTSICDIKPIWNFIGLEDARLVYWNDKYYAVGVRRDTTTNGQGRMEFSELEISSNSVKEIKRHRIEVENTDSYCEKNWMPIKDKPFCFVKWTNPTEIVQVDLDNNKATQIYSTSKYIEINNDWRGGSQLINWDNNTYLSIIHNCNFIPENFNGFKDSDYYHFFIIWNSDYSIKYISEPFNFMTAKVEFCIGLEKIENDIFIAFGFQDNGAYLIKLSKENIDNILWNKLKPLFLDIEKEKLK